MPLDMRGRHAQARPQPPAMWKCVACGAENAGPLEAGCQLCGSGKPGTHIEQDLVQRQQVPTDPPPAADTTSVDEAFLQWNKGRNFDGPERQLAYEAFSAGFMIGIAQVGETGVQLSGTAESRTIVAALRVFKESILPTAQEEIASGEFLDGPSIDRLIIRLERIGS